MWYYELNQQPFGPVSKETIADELRSGKITAQTRVWREGWAEWRRLGETELGLLIAPVPSSAGVGSAGAPPPVYVNPPVYMSLPQYKKVDPNSLTKLFWWWFGLTLTFAPFYILSFFISNQPWAIGLLCAVEIPLMAGGVLQYILIYKFWQIVQDGFARTSPGKAVGFLFIPFFNFYWLFVAYFGLSRDFKSYIERHLPYGSVRKPHPALALSYLIFGWVFVLGYFVLMIFMFGSLISLASDPTAMTSFMQPYSYIFYIFGFVQICFLIVLFFDFFLTAKSILSAEQK